MNDLHDESSEVVTEAGTTAEETQEETEEVGTDNIGFTEFKQKHPGNRVLLFELNNLRSAVAPWNVMI